MQQRTGKNKEKKLKSKKNIARSCEEQYPHHSPTHLTSNLIHGTTHYGSNGFLSTTYVCVFE